MGDVNESLYMPHRPTERRDEWQGPIWNDCGCCNYARRTLERDDLPRWCVWCVTDNLAALKTLARNLAIAAFGCASFEMGRDAGPKPFVPFKTSWWRPGCGKPWTWPHVTRDDGAP